MRTFIIVGHHAPTSPSFSLDNLKGGAGRLDILLRCITSAFLLSHDLRRDVELHIVLLGHPRPPVSLRFQGSRLRFLNPDERSTAQLVRRALATAVEPGMEKESTPGLFVSCRGLGEILDGLSSPLVQLREDGEDFRSMPLAGDMAFLLSDHGDLTAEEEALPKVASAKRASVGPQSLHADHCIVVVQNELDRRSPEASSPRGL